MHRIAPFAVVLVGLVLSFSPAGAQDTIGWEVSQPLSILAGEEGVLSVVLENTNTEPIDAVLSLELLSVARSFDMERQLSICELAHPPRLNTTGQLVALEPSETKEFSFLITTSQKTPAGVYAGQLMLITDTNTSLGVITFCVHKKSYAPLIMLVLTTCLLAALTAYAVRRENN
ncbi:MAG: hypothetical protein ACXQT1_01665 [Methermicoccaceae archaeon]